MAEQYQSFNSQAPNISISLFGDAAQAGAKLGKDIPNPITSAIEGGIKGYQQGQEAAIRNQQIQETQQRIDTNSDPDVQEAKKQVILAQGDAAKVNDANSKLQAQVDAQNQDIKIKTANNELQIQAKQTQQTLTDLNNKEDIQKIISENDPEALASILNNGGYRNTLSRDTAFANQTIGALRGKVNPDQLDSAQRQFDALELEKQRASLIHADENRKQEYATKKSEEFTTAQQSLRGLQGFSEVSDLTKNKNFNYQKLQILPSSTVDVVDGQLAKNLDGTVKRKELEIGAPDKGSILVYGNKVLDTIPTAAEGAKYNTFLQQYKTGAAANGFLTPIDEPTEATTETSANKAQLLTDDVHKSDTSGSANANQNIIDAASTRNQKAFQSAQSAGQGSSYQALMAQGSSLARQQSSPKTNYIQSSQATPVAPGQPKITQAVPEADPTPFPSATNAPNAKVVPKLPSIGSVDHAEQHLSSALGVPKQNVSLDVGVQKPVLTNAVFTKINNIEALKDSSAFVKGAVAVESGGNPLANSGKAAGLMQLTPGTAADLGISNKERYDPSKSVEGGTTYFAQTYDKIKKDLSGTIGLQGVNGEPDPRFVLAAYNGGEKYIKNGIRAGNLTWDSMQTYLRSVKSKDAADENIAYPDKVLLASIPFIKGGNASDDSFVKTLLSFGIANVDI